MVTLPDVLDWAERLPRPPGTPKGTWRAILIEATREMADAASNEDWMTFVLSAPVFYRLNVCDMLERAGVPAVELYGPLQTAWAEAIRPDEMMPLPGIVALFQRIGFFSDDGSERPDAPLRVFRGASLERVNRGLSWTTNSVIAQWYASFFGADGLVFTSLVPPDSVLARFTREGEDEALVDPCGLDIQPIYNRGYAPTLSFAYPAAH